MPIIYHETWLDDQSATLRSFEFWHGIRDPEWPVDRRQVLELNGWEQPCRIIRIIRWHASGRDSDYGILEFEGIGRPIRKYKVESDGKEQGIIIDKRATRGGKSPDPWHR